MFRKTVEEFQASASEIEGPGLAKSKKAIAAIGARTTFEEAFDLGGWPGDIEPPRLRSMRAAGHSGAADIEGWKARETGRRRREIKRAEAERRLRDGERQDYLRRLKDAQRAASSEQASPPAPIVGEFLSLLVMIGAGAADYVVLQHVFQFVDINETSTSTSILAISVSVILMLGGVVVGRALRVARTVSADGDRSRRRDVGALILFLLLVALAVAIGLIRATAVEPDSSLQAILGLQPRTIAAVGFVLLQLGALAIAIGVAYYGYRLRAYRDASTVSQRRLHRWVERRSERMAILQARIDTYTAEIEAIIEVAAAATEELAAYCESEWLDAKQRMAAAVGLGGHHLASTTD